MKTCKKLLWAVTMVGQLGFTILTPPVALALLAWWLQRKFDLGVWVMLAALAVGLMTSVASAVQFYHRAVSASEKRRPEEDEKEKPVVFYKHE